MKRQRTKARQPEVNRTIDKAQRLLREIQKVLKLESREAEALWSILTALRGPDAIYRDGCFVLHNKLKELTTARLRGFLIDRAGCSGLLRRANSGLTVRSSPLTLQEQRERDVLLRQPDVDSHFESHISQAYNGVKHIFQYNLWNEQDLSANTSTTTKKKRSQ